MAREKNLCGKTRPIDNPYEIWEAPGWKWLVLKKYQTPKNEKKNPYARWFCAVSSPYIDGYGMGDTYVRDITRSARQTYVDPTILLEQAITMPSKEDIVDQADAILGGA